MLDPLTRPFTYIQVQIEVFGWHSGDPRQILDQQLDVVHPVVGHSTDRGDVLCRDDEVPIGHNLAIGDQLDQVGLGGLTEDFHLSILDTKRAVRVFGVRHHTSRSLFTTRSIRIRL